MLHCKTVLSEEKKSLAMETVQTNVEANNDGGHCDEEGPTIQKIEDIIEIDPDCYELDLNHQRIGKIENLEPLRQIERYTRIYLPCFN